MDVIVSDFAKLSETRGLAKRHVKLWLFLAMHLDPKVAVELTGFCDEYFTQKVTVLHQFHTV
jgi:hypothetical protein